MSLTSLSDNLGHGGVFLSSGVTVGEGLPVSDKCKVKHEGYFKCM